MQERVLGKSLKEFLIQIQTQLILLIIILRIEGQQLKMPKLSQLENKKDKYLKVKIFRALQM